MPPVTNWPGPSNTITPERRRSFGLLVRTFIAAGTLGFGKIAFGRIPRGERDFQCKKCSVCLIDYHRELGLTFDTALFCFLACTAVLIVGMSRSTLVLCNSFVQRHKARNLFPGLAAVENVERGRANRLQYVWVCLCALRRVLALHGEERARSEGDEGRQRYSHRDVSQLGKWLLELLSFFWTLFAIWFTIQLVVERLIAQSANVLLQSF